MLCEDVYNRVQMAELMYKNVMSAKPNPGNKQMTELRMNDQETDYLLSVLADYKDVLLSLPVDLAVKPRTTSHYFYHMDQERK